MRVNTVITFLLFFLHLVSLHSQNHSFIIISTTVLTKYCNRYCFVAAWISDEDHQQSAPSFPPPRASAVLASGSLRQAWPAVAAAQGRPPNAHHRLQQQVGHVRLGVALPQREQRAVRQPQRWYATRRSQREIQGVSVGLVSFWCAVTIDRIFCLQLYPLDTIQFCCRWRAVHIIDCSLL